MTIRLIVAALLQRQQHMQDYLWLIHDEITSFTTSHSFYLAFVFLLNPKCLPKKVFKFSGLNLQNKFVNAGKACWNAAWHKYYHQSLTVPVGVRLQDEESTAQHPTNTSRANTEKPKRKKDSCCCYANKCLFLLLNSLPTATSFISVSLCSHSILLWINIIPAMRPVAGRKAEETQTKLAASVENRL